MKAHLYVTAELAIEFREARKRKGFRQEDLALEGFLSTGTISRIERGSVSVSREKVAYLSEQLGINIQKYHQDEEEADPVDLSLKLLSIENHLNLISTDEAWEELRKIKPDTEYHRIWTLYLRGRYWERKGKSEKAKVMYLQITETNDPELRKHNLISSSFHALGRIYFYEEQVEQSLMFIEKGLEQFNHDGEREHIYHFLCISKVIYLENLDRNEEALLAIEELWNKKQGINSREVILSIFEMKTRILTKFSRYDQAISLAHDGLMIARINRMYDHCSSLWIALGECYQQQGSLKNAEISFESAVKMVQKMKNKYLIVQVFIRMGKLYEQINSHKKAHQMYISAVRISKKNADLLRVAESLEYLADYYLEYEELEKARNTYEESLHAYQNQGSTMKRRNILMKLARCYCDTNREKYYAILDEYYQIYSFD